MVRGLSAGWGSCLRTVLLNDIPWALVCCKDTLALSSGIYIITLDAATGSKTAILSGHTDDVKSLTPSPDGTILVSGSADKTIKFWDMQTGGVIKTFHGHTSGVRSVSISADYTTIASCSWDKTIRLWNIQTGECYCIIQQEFVSSICFFALKSQHFISVSVGKVQEWDVNGHQVTPAYDGSCVSFSLDGTKFILCNGAVIQVQTSDSREVVTEFHVENAGIRANVLNAIGYCCFSPDGRLIAFAVHHTAYVLDITNSEPSLIETLIGHTYGIVSLAFLSPTSLISGSWDESVKFWQIGVSSISPDVTDLKSIFYTSPIKSITLQAKDGIAISSDSDGVVRIWDLLTGLCKASLQTPAKDSPWRDVQLIDSRLVLVWYAAAKIHVWDIKKEKLLQAVNAPWNDIEDIRISGDGSKVFCLEFNSIHAWYIWTGEVMGEVPLGYDMHSDSFLATGGSSVWVGFRNHGIAGWDFGVLDSSLIKEYTELPKRPHLDFIGGMRQHRSILPVIEDSTTGREVFQLPSRYARPSDAQWDGQYLVAGYDTGEVLILDCNCKIAH